MTTRITRPSSIIVSASGTGHYHGQEGFDTFSKLKPVVSKQRLSSLKLVYPPYGGRIQRLIARLIIGSGQRL
jgi:coniferyl-aldehyde dehydrogenase